MTTTGFDTSAIPQLLQPRLGHHLAALAERDGGSAAPELLSGLADSLPRVWACSDFVAEACLRDDALLGWLGSTAGRLHSARTGSGWQRGSMSWSATMTTTRTTLLRSGASGEAQLARIAWRDLASFADVDEILRELTLLADVCIDSAFRRANLQLAARHGAPRSADGAELPLLTLGMGKLGGGELNFSSDIDLVLLFPEHGETSGPRSLDHQEYYIRLGQRMAQWLGAVTADGFVYRVDLRLRPFGDSGPLAVSFDAFEDYLQQHGRDWERYAYVKARPVTGAASFEGLYRDVLRPFVYRRYLDYRVFESLRDMKELIAREVERRDLQDNVKLGPGGIREIEFIVQAFQLIRGGRDPRLQTRSLLDALSMLAGQKLLDEQAVSQLAESYRFLRRVENRLQQWNDDQTHELPSDEAGRVRLAFAMDMHDWGELEAELSRHRSRVSGHFRRLVLAPPEVAAADESDRAMESLLRRQLDDTQRAALLAPLGLADLEGVLGRLNQLRESSYFRHLDATGRRRLRTLLPRLLRETAGRGAEQQTLARLIHVLEQIGGRTVYLALLNESVVARRRLTELCARSQFLSDQIAGFPLLLDELLDERLFESLPARAQLEADLRSRMAGLSAEDPEHQVEVLREFQRSAVFRVAVPDITGRLPLMKVSDLLTDIAELIVAEALNLSWQQIGAKYGQPLCGADESALREAGLIVIAYGKFGGFELGYGSDLDLVFLHDSGGEIQHTVGPQVLDNGVFFTRLVQRLVHLLTVHSSAGRLYEVDTRLRPSGKGGLLVQSVAGFAAYQREEAWTWEHQALLHSRAVAGEQALRDRFEELRREILCTSVRRDTLREDVRSMRERMRGELSRAGRGEFDLKQDRGGITDIEFLAQYWSLRWADRHPELVTYPDVIRQLESLASIALVPQQTVDVLTSAYRAYRQRIHHLSLEGDSSVVSDEEFREPREQVGGIWAETMERGSVPPAVL